MTEFEDLNTSTITMMVDSNLFFVLMQIFSPIPVTYIDPPLTKKKRIDKKKLKSPYRSVISLQYGVYIRGIRLSKEKKYWCPTSQLKVRERRFSPLRKLFA